MESFMASWPSPAINGLIQDVSINTALISPPSPVRSPTLYDQAKYGNGSPNKESKLVSRSQLADSLLRDIEFARDLQYPQNDYLGEEIVNLELFQDLESTYDNFEHDLTPPLTPELSFVHDQLYETPVPSPPLVGEFPDETFNQLNAEFQKILDSLPESSFEVNEDAMELIENIMDLRDDVEQENGDDNSSTNEDNYNEDESSQESMDAEDGQSGHTSNDDSMEVKWTYFSGAQISEEEEVADASEKILDALLDGDLIKANSYLPQSNVSLYQHQPVQVITLLPSTTVHLPLNLTASASKTEVAKTSAKKSGSRSKAKPKTTMKKPRLSARVDRVQRKKDQNKTAATRYREKKKVLASIVSKQEGELTVENNELIEKKNDLSKQISIVKQLLRDVMNAKKKNFGSLKRKI